MTGHIGTETATKFIEYHTLFAKWDSDQILLAGKIPAIDHLNKIEAYALLSACVAYLLSHLRKVNFQMNPELERKLCGLIAVDRAMSGYHREIVPLGLKTLLVSEKQTTGEIGIVRRLVEEADVVVKRLEVA